MKVVFLILYGRKGCCLCEGLEQRLRGLPLQDLRPPLKLCVIDIDALDTPPRVRERYDIEVPVMLLGSKDLNETIELPRVSPRLNKEGLFNWVQKALLQTYGLE